MKNILAMSGSKFYQMRKFKARKVTKNTNSLDIEQLEGEPMAIKNFGKAMIKKSPPNASERSLELQMPSLCHKQILLEDLATKKNELDKNRKLVQDSGVELHVCNIAFFHNILNSDDKNLKRAIVEYSLKTFLGGKSPVNVRFYKYIDRFKVFSVYSLAHAAALLKISSFISKSDVRSFIYIFLAFGILSTKLQDDFSIWNSLYNEAWNLSLRQVSNLEILALSGIDYNLEVESSTIEEILMSSIEYKQKHKM